MSSQTWIGKTNGLVTVTNISKNYVSLQCECGSEYTTQIRTNNKIQPATPSCGCRGIQLVQGDKIGPWTYVEYLGRGKGKVRCECGLEKETTHYQITKGLAHVCYVTKGFKGLRFGRLIITSQSDIREGNDFRYNLSCDCGGTTTAVLANLKRGNTRSCGCLQKEIASARGKAGMPKSKKPGYRTAHDRVRSLKGKASEQICVACSGPAREWAYDHQDPDELIEWETTNGSSYSLKPEHYQAMCKKCHRAFDDTEDLKLVA